MVICPSLLACYLVLFLDLTQSDEGVDIVFANHRYFDKPSSSTQTPRSLQRPVFNNQPPRLTHDHHRRTLSTRLKTTSSNPQSSRLTIDRRSGDIIPMDHAMDYPQYDVMDEHGHKMHVYRSVPYARYPVYEKPSSRFDISSIGIIAILKLILIKILSIGFFKILFLFFLKFPLIIFTLGFKFLIILKLIKLVKLLTIPIVIPIIIIIILPILIVAFFLVVPLLLPLILAPVIPLILIPILLPLILSLPVPVLAPAGRRRREDSVQSRSVQDDVLFLVRRVLESEQCIERVACQLAANKQSRGYASYVAW